MVNEFGVDPEKTRNPNTTTLKILAGIVGIFAILCGLVVSGILYKFGQPYFGPKTQIILEPDYSRVSTADAADLEAAAEILTERSRSLGISGISFTAVENNRIIGRVPGSVDAETAVEPIIAVGLLEFVDFGERPIDTGALVRTDFEYPYFPQAEGEIWHTVMTNAEFEQVDVSTDQIGKPAVSFTLTGKGTKILADFTANNVGHYLGIVVDKVVVSSPVVNSPITDGMGIIQGSFTAEEANALAAYLRTKGPLPFPLIIKQIVTNDPAP